MQSKLLTAGGRIECLRCTARSIRTGLQCGRPALKASKTQKCGHHGGLSTGPRTAAGRERISNAHFVDGQSSKASRAESSTVSARLARLEDALIVLGIFEGARTRGRKAAGYKPVTSVQEVVTMLLEDRLHPINDSFELTEFLSVRPMDR